MRKYAVQYAERFSGERHDGFVWAGSIDGADRRAWAVARNEDWRVVEVVGADGDMAYPEPEDPCVAPWLVAYDDDVVLSDEYVGITREQAEELAWWVYRRSA
jgi:hypothetical protein